MRAPLSWLREFTPVEGKPEEIARALSFLGLVVEGTEVIGAPLPGVVVARVLETRAHPAADRIQLVDVDLGDGEALQICCGAFNMKPGDLVPLATLGTVMPNGMEIARRKMRGEWSNGMLCSAPELELGEEGGEKGIYVLPTSAQPGSPVADVLGLGPDVVFDIEVGPNRSDCFSVAGVARDLAAALGLPFSLPEPPRSVDPLVARAEVSLAPGAEALCPRFTGTVLEGVQAAAVPALVRRRLSLAGMRPISPVVDVSNYVMLELGQPNHPYDLALLGGGGLVVRRARDGEELVTLDGVARRLSERDLVIADGTGAAVGVAGIMGGTSCEISASTTTVLLEVANFDPLAVAATGQRLGLHTEARTRFERGVDIELADRAVDRFAQLLGPGARRGVTTDVGRGLPARPPVRLRVGRVNQLLGTELSAEACRRLLGPLGFVARPDGPDAFSVTVPSWRPDCSREVDLVEEVARVHGYENIPRRMPPRPARATFLSPHQRARRRVRELLAGTGAHEAWTATFVSADELAACALEPGEALELENPLDQSQGLLRTSLLPGLARAARFNRERQAGAMALFELGSVFRRPEVGGTAREASGDRPVEGVDEREQLGVLAVGDGAGATWAVQAFEVLRRGLALSQARLAPAGPSTWPGAAAFHPGRVAAVMVGERAVGLVGEVAPDVAERYDLPGRAGLVLADLVPLLRAADGRREAAPVSRYPATDLDLAFEVGEEVSADELGRALSTAAGGLLTDVALFDVWRGAPLGPGRRSLAFRLRLRSAERTLTEADVAEVREAAQRAAHALGAALRQG